MIGPEAEADLRDRWCVQLLEATSPPHALARARLEQAAGRPVYDDPDGRTLHPRLRPCKQAGCAIWFWAERRSDQVYCSLRCLRRDYRARRDARRVA